MGEPMRWLLMGLDPLYPIEVIDGPALSNKSVRVREDGATEIDIEAVTQRLFLRRYPGLGWVPGGGRYVAQQAECRRDARELLALVFGEEASRV